MRITKKWKNIISIALAALVLFGAVGAVASFATNDTKTIGFGEFEIGSLNEVDGQYVEDKTAIFTKDAFECQGLKVKPEFDSDVTYQIFWYNEDELYLDCTQKTTLKSAQFVGDTPELAKYARIVIFPSQLDDEGKQIKDFKVSIFDIPGIVKNLKITVNKEQNYEEYNLLENLKLYNSSMGTKNEILLNGNNVLIENVSFSTSYTTNLNDATVAATDGYDIIKLVCNKYSVYRLELSPGNGFHFLFYTSDGTYIADALYGAGTHFVEVPETSEDLIIVIQYEKIDEDCVLRPYLTR